MPDGISCVGLLLLIVIVLATVGVSLGGAAFGQNGDSTNLEAAATKTAVTAPVEALDTVIPTQLSTDPATATEAQPAPSLTAKAVERGRRAQVDTAG